MVSVIVITYNQQEYIEMCLKSIIDQSINMEFEILVGDDASIDNTPNIIKEYVQRYPNIIKPVLRKENVGATKNLLDLINRAQGEYIAFCEGDDYWVGTVKLAEQVAFLEQDFSCFGTVHDVMVVDKVGIESKSHKINWIEDSKDYYSIDDFLGVGIPGHLSSLVCRKCVLENQLDFNILFCDRNASDKMIFLLVLAKGRIGCIHKKFSAYRFMRDTFSNNLIAKMQLSKKSYCVKDMKMLNAMDFWTTKHCGIEKHFVTAQSRVLVTALFHQIKGYDVSFFEVLNMCSHKYLALARFPIAFVEQFVQKIKVMFGLELR